MKTVAKNKRAYFDYEILDTYEAGIVLLGPEVKSAKLGNVSLKESHAVVTNGEIFLLNAHITPYKMAGNTPHDPTRSRKLLLKSNEIQHLIGKIKEKGLSLIPIKMYVKRGLVKVELGLGRGKKKYEKREKIKQKDINHDIERELRGKTKNSR